MNPIRSAASCEVVNVNKKAGIVTHTITTGGVNLNGHDVVQAGIDTTEFDKGGIVLFNHDDSLPAIGKNIGLMFDRPRDRWVADTEFARTQFGEELLYLYHERFMRAWSIGFRPLEQEAVKDKGGTIMHFKFPKIMLKEYSAVTLAANVDAVTHARNDKLITEATFQLLTTVPADVATPSDLDALAPAFVERLKARRMQLSVELSRRRLS